MIDILEFKIKYNDIQCCTTPERDVFILSGGLGNIKPDEYLDEACAVLMEGSDYNHYIEEFLDNPYVRVLITTTDYFKKVRKKGYYLYYKELPSVDAPLDKCSISILIGGLGKVNPNSYMDYIASEYIGYQGHNTFIDKNHYNPWVRVIVTGINDLKYE